MTGRGVGKQRWDGGLVEQSTHHGCIGSPHSKLITANANTVRSLEVVLLTHHVRPHPHAQTQPMGRAAEHEAIVLK